MDATEKTEFGRAMIPAVAETHFWGGGELIFHAGDPDGDDAWVVQAADRCSTPPDAWRRLVADYTAEYGQPPQFFDPNAAAVPVEYRIFGAPCADGGELCTGPHDICPGTDQCVVEIEKHAAGDIVSRRWVRESNTQKLIEIHA